jgi:hypothetical protein
MRPYLKNNQSTKGWWNDSSGELLPSKCEALSSNPNSAKKVYVQTLILFLWVLDKIICQNFGVDCPVRN